MARDITFENVSVPFINNTLPVDGISDIMPVRECISWCEHVHFQNDVGQFLILPALSLVLIIVAYITFVLRNKLPYNQKTIDRIIDYSIVASTMLLAGYMWVVSS